MTGTIKVFDLIQERVQQSDPKLDWEMFHKIYHMYRDINNKEETNAALLLISMSDHEDIKKVIKTTLNSPENHQKEIPFRVRTIVPPALHQIQPRATQVWNCDEIGFDLNNKWHKVVCTYMYFQG